jgi:hypothetical protein
MISLRRFKYWFPVVSGYGCRQNIVKTILVLKLETKEIKFSKVLLNTFFIQFKIISKLMHMESG